MGSKHVSAQMRHYYRNHHWRGEGARIAEISVGELGRWIEVLEVEQRRIEALEGALVEERAERNAAYDVADRPQRVDDLYRAGARAELTKEGLLNG